MGTTPPVEKRTLRRVSRQTMVALPAWVQRRLGIGPGSAVYWHPHRPGEVVMAAHEERRRGPAGHSALEDEVRALTEERDQLLRQLSGHDLAGQRAVYAQSYMQMLRYLGPITDRMETLMRKVDAVIETRYGQAGDARRFRRARAKAARRPVEVVTLGDEYPSPSPSPSSAFSGGDVASGGDTPQATHE